MKIVIGNDHVAVEMKKEIKAYLEEKGYEVTDVGTDNPERFNFPISAYKASQVLLRGDADYGILICGTGVGIGIAANKIKGIRCAVCSEPVSAELSRQHNNANIVAMGARMIGPVMAEAIVDKFLNTEFLGGRHQLRVDMMTKLENGGTLE